MAFVIEDQIGELAGDDLVVDSQRDGDLLIVPLHHVEGEFEQLSVGEVRAQLGAQGIVDVAGL